jgi:sugar (pentulose or hexulose) kinase
MYFIGIDIGTTNCKICLFKAPDFTLVSKYSFITPKINSGETSDFDIEKLWNGIEKGLEKAAKSVENPSEIKHISVASVGEAGVLTDSAGNVKGPVMTWYDTRTAKISKDIIKRTGRKKIYEITGLPAHSNYSLNKILWIKTHIGEFSGDYKWLCMAEYMTYKLTGIKKSEFSLASRTMALDIKKKKWSEDILKAEFPEQDIFPEMGESGVAAGVITEETAKKTGLAKTTTVSTAGHDHMCGSTAAGIHDDRDILNSTGTTEGLLFLKNRPELGEDFYNANFSNGIHVLKDLYTVYSSLPSAGYAIEWFKNEYNITDDEFIRMTEKLYEKITDKNYKPKSEGIFIPHLRGSGPPKRSTKSKALIYGITDQTTKEELLLIIFQGLCFELKNLLNTIEELTFHKFEEIKVIGAACKSRLWLKLKADILNKNILAYEIDEAVSKGAAMLGAYKNGYIKDLRIIGEDKDIKKIKPDKKAAEYYNKIFSDIYKAFYDFKINIENRTDQDFNEIKCKQ